MDMIGCSIVSSLRGGNHRQCSNGPGCNSNNSSCTGSMMSCGGKTSSSSYNRQEVEALYCSDEFRMYFYKVQPCSKVSVQEPLFSTEVASVTQCQQQVHW
jgi:hypothetical protein